MALNILQRAQWSRALNQLANGPNVGNAETIVGLLCSDNMDQNELNRLKPTLNADLLDDQYQTGWQHFLGSHAHGRSILHAIIRNTNVAEQASRTIRLFLEQRDGGNFVAQLNDEFWQAQHNELTVLGAVLVKYGDRMPADLIHQLADRLPPALILSDTHHALTRNTTAQAITTLINLTVQAYGGDTIQIVDGVVNAADAEVTLENIPAEIKSLWFLAAREGNITALTRLHTLYPRIHEAQDEDHENKTALTLTAEAGHLQAFRALTDWSGRANAIAAITHVTAINADRANTLLETLLPAALEAVDLHVEFHDLWQRAAVTAQGRVILQTLSQHYTQALSTMMGAPAKSGLQVLIDNYEGVGIGVEVGFRNHLSDFIIDTVPDEQRLEVFTDILTYAVTAELNPPNQVRRNEAVAAIAGRIPANVNINSLDVPAASVQRLTSLIHYIQTTAAIGTPAIRANKIADILKRYPALIIPAHDGDASPLAFVGQHAQNRVASILAVFNDHPVPANANAAYYRDALRRMANWVAAPPAGTNAVSIQDMANLLARGQGDQVPDLAEITADATEELTHNNRPHAALILVNAALSRVADPQAANTPLPPEYHQLWREAAERNQMNILQVLCAKYPGALSQNIADEADHNQPGITYLMDNVDIRPETISHLVADLLPIDEAIAKIAALQAAVTYASDDANRANQARMNSVAAAIPRYQHRDAGAAVTQAINEATFIEAMRAAYPAAYPNAEGLVNNPDLASQLLIQSRLTPEFLEALPVISPTNEDHLNALRALITRIRTGQGTDEHNSNTIRAQKIAAILQRYPALIVPAVEGQPSPLAFVAEHYQPGNDRATVIARIITAFGTHPGAATATPANYTEAMARAARLTPTPPALTAANIQTITNVLAGQANEATVLLQAGIAVDADNITAATRLLNAWRQRPHTINQFTGARPFTETLAEAIRLAQAPGLSDQVLNRRLELVLQIARHGIAEDANNKITVFDTALLAGRNGDIAAAANPDLANANYRIRETLLNTNPWPTDAAQFEEKLTRLTTQTRAATPGAPDEPDSDETRRRNHLIGRCHALAESFFGAPDARTYNPAAVASIITAITQVTADLPPVYGAAPGSAGPAPAYDLVPNLLRAIPIPTSDPHKVDYFQHLVEVFKNTPRSLDVSERDTDAHYHSHIYNMIKRAIRTGEIPLDILTSQAGLAIHPAAGPGATETQKNNQYKLNTRDGKVASLAFLLRMIQHADDLSTTQRAHLIAAVLTRYPQLMALPAQDGQLSPFAFVATHDETAATNIITQFARIPFAQNIKKAAYFQAAGNLIHDANEQTQTHLNRLLSLYLEGEEPQLQVDTFVIMAESACEQNKIACAKALYIQAFNIARNHNIRLPNAAATPENFHLLLRRLAEDAKPSLLRTTAPLENQRLLINLLNHYTDFEQVRQQVPEGDQRASLQSQILAALPKIATATTPPQKNAVIKAYAHLSSAAMIRVHLITTPPRGLTREQYRLAAEAIQSRNDIADIDKRLFVTALYDKAVTTSSPDVTHATLSEDSRQLLARAIQDCDINSVIRLTALYAPNTERNIPVPLGYHPASPTLADHTTLLGQAVHYLLIAKNAGRDEAEIATRTAIIKHLCEKWLCPIAPADGTDIAANTAYENAKAEYATQINSIFDALTTPASASVASQAAAVILAKYLLNDTPADIQQLLGTARTLITETGAFAIQWDVVKALIEQFDPRMGLTATAQNSIAAVWQAALTSPTPEAVNVITALLQHYPQYFAAPNSPLLHVITTVNVTSQAMTAIVAALNSSAYTPEQRAAIINARTADASATTALHLAVGYNRFDIADALLQTNDIDVEIADAGDNTPLSLAVDKAKAAAEANQIPADRTADEFSTLVSVISKLKTNAATPAATFEARRQQCLALMIPLFKHTIPSA